MLKEKNYIFKGGKNIIIFDVEHSVANVTKPDEKKEDEQISKIGEAGEWIDSTISSILLQQIINYCVPITY